MGFDAALVLTNTKFPAAHRAANFVHVLSIIPPPCARFFDFGSAISDL